MENIRHFFCVDLSTSSIRTLSKKDNGKLLYPYKDVVITVDEVHICPFCGKIVQNLECNCNRFKTAFAKLQDSCSDKEHDSCLHFPDSNIKSGFSKSISDFHVKVLSKDEILELGLDLWDFATRYTDRFSEKSYLVTPASQDGDKLFLLCKDLSSKKVYRFEIPMLNYKDKSIYLGVYEQKTVSHGGRKLGNYHFEYYWRDLKEFEDWNGVCKVLKKIKN